jgi:hypothetical protein
MMATLGLCLLSWLAVVTLSGTLVPAWPQQAAAQDPDPHERLARLKKQLELFRDIRAKHQREDFFRLSREAAVQLEEDGLAELRKYEVAKAAYSVLEAAPAGAAAYMQRILRVDKMSQRDAAAAREFIEAYVNVRLGTERIKTGGVAKDAIELVGKIAERRVAGTLSKADIDNAILAVDGFEFTLKNSTEVLNRIPGGRNTAKANEQMSVAAEVMGASVRGVLYGAKYHEAKTAAERLEARNAALKEAMKLLQTGAKLTENHAVTALSTKIKLAQVNAEVYSRLVYWAGLHMAASGLRHQASQVQSEAINQLNYSIMTTQMEIDRAERAVRQAERKASRPLREPGGIKLNNVPADAVAQRLDIRALAFDPVSGKLIIEGTASRHEFDLGIFQTVLRLAAEEDEPFFSLNEANVGDFDTILSDISRRIHDKYVRPGDAAMARRLASVGLRIPLKDGRECYFADIARLDPDIHRASLAGYDNREEKVYSPEWLRYTKVGRILYEADTHIKSIVAGFREVDGEIKLADVWDVPGFEPTFLRERGKAGRANLELAVADVATTRNRVDLSSVKPKLVYVERKAGTTQDLPPTDEHKRIVDHFDRNWQAYVDRVPPLAELMMVYRAYVAARYLTAKQPRLKQQILDFGSPNALDIWPLYVPAPMAVAGCVARGRLAPMRADGSILSYGGALSGGTSFKYGKKITFDERARPASAEFLPMAELRRQEGIIERQDRIAMIVEFDSDPLPTQDQWRGLGGCVAAALVLGAVLFGWRRLRPAPPISQAVCLHCVGVHRGIETAAALTDLLAVAALSFLVVLPFMAAWHVDEPQWQQVAAAAGLTAGLLIAGASLGFLAHRFVGTIRPAASPLIAPVRWLGAGSRWSGLAVAIVLLSNGAGKTAMAERLVGIDLEIGSRFVQAIGDLGVVRTAALILVGCSLASLLLRWFLPYLLSSRPLLLGLHHPERVAAT